MDPLLRERMLRYYDERAADYEEAYVRGTGTASIADPEIFKLRPLGSRRPSNVLDRAGFNSKVERQQRTLNDGRSFHIYKRYLSRADVEQWPDRYGVHISAEYFGPAVFAVSGSFEPERRTSNFEPRTWNRT